MKFLIFLVLALSVLSINALDRVKDCKCRVQTQNRIINGTLIQDRAYPWLAQMKIKIDRENMTVCAATILDEWHLLTSGHCAAHAIDSEFGLNITEIRFNSLEKNIGIQKVIPHPLFKKVSDYKFDFDLVILKLKQKLNFTNTEIQPACFDTQSSDLYKGLGQIVGWGSTKMVVVRKNSTVSPIVPSKFLRKIDVFDTTKFDSNCKNETDKFICVNSNKKVANCLGDIGLHYTNFGLTKIVGISELPETQIDSEGTVKACYKLTRFSRISYYKDWINSVVGNFCN